MTIAASTKHVALALALAGAGLMLALRAAPVQAQAFSIAPPKALPPVPSNKTQLLWLGQAAFRITTPGGKTIVIDPWITGGTRTPAVYKTDLGALGKVDLLLVTHAHGDHLGDAPALAKMHNTRLYGPGDMIASMNALGILPPELTHRLNKSGHVTPLPGIKVTAVAADHSSILTWPNAATGKTETHPAGEAMGYIIELENGFRIWHMGDTGLFGDMKFIADHYQPDLVLAPIGGNFTMDPDDAAFAIRTWINPRSVIAIHYNANPQAKGTLAQFQEAMKGSPVKVVPMTEGQTVEF